MSYERLTSVGTVTDPSNNEYVSLGTINYSYNSDGESGLANDAELYCAYAYAYANEDKIVVETTDYSGNTSIDEYESSRFIIWSYSNDLEVRHDESYYKNYYDYKTFLLYDESIQLDSSYTYYDPESPKDTIEYTFSSGNTITITINSKKEDDSDSFASSIITDFIFPELKSFD